MSWRSSPNHVNKRTDVVDVRADIVEYGVVYFETLMED